MTTPILRIAIASPMRSCFDYLLPPKLANLSLQAGMRVIVPFRNTERIGILLGTAKESAVPKNKLKAILAIVDSEPLFSAMMLQWVQWAADYYHYPIGEVLLSCLPALLREGNKLPIPQEITAWQLQQPALTLNEFQQQALNSILSQPQFHTFLLDGVTGSGKTEVYLQSIAHQLAQQKQALILVPEIGLTPQTVARFTARFAAPIVVLHSSLTEKQRLAAWAMARDGSAAIIIGTRSAIFTPLKNPGIIIIDEEHDLSFKQQNGFRYSARDVAIVRARLENIPILLGSATPSLESLQNVERQRYTLLNLPERAGDAVPPKFNIVDIRNKKLNEGLTDTLLKTIERHLQNQGQVLLFLNRRGFAPVLLCHACGWMAQCQRCDARLTLHQQPKQLVCHHCESQQTVIKICPTCQSNNLIALGLGTERLEQALQQSFPNYSITRIDRDSTRRKGALQEKLADIQAGKSQILIGTQMLTKGHHFPNLTLVAIVNTDNYLFSSDFRASERLGQLITQVGGRAGRAEKIGEVVIQTHYPEHPLLQVLLQNNYANFSTTLLQERKSAQLPPFTSMALLRAEATAAKAPSDFLHAAATLIKQLAHKQINLLGPMPAPMERKAGLYRAQLFIQTNQRALLQTILKTILPSLEKNKTTPKVRWSLDVDPLELF